MEHIIELTTILQVLFPWNKSRIECLSQIIIALFSARTVNTATLAENFIGDAKKESSSKRILRLFDWIPSIWGYRRLLTKAVISILDLSDEKIHLSMDRTEWELGCLNINLLVIGIQYRNICVPIYFKSIAKKGCSFTRQRISVIKSILQVIDVANIKSFSADREFMGREWFNYLIEKEIPFVIRIKKDTRVKRKNSNLPIPIEELGRRIKKNRKKIFIEPYAIWGFELHIAIARNSHGELMIIASNFRSKDIFKYYLKRWSIESLFKYLKTHGFNLEDTHIKDSRKLEALIFILTLAVLCRAFL